MALSSDLALPPKAPPIRLRQDCFVIFRNLAGLLLVPVLGGCTIGEADPPLETTVVAAEETYLIRSKRDPVVGWHNWITRAGGRMTGA